MHVPIVDYIFIHMILVVRTKICFKISIGIRHDCLEGQSVRVKSNLYGLLNGDRFEQTNNESRRIPLRQSCRPILLPGDKSIIIVLIYNIILAKSVTRSRKITTTAHQIIE